MTEFLMQVMTIFGGVLGSLIGFITIAGVALFLALPYVLLVWRRPGSKRGARTPVEDRRY